MSRYFYPKFNRFLSRDIELGTIGKVLSHNSMSYCDNSPVLFSDTNGCRKTLSTDDICDFDTHDWGTHTTPLPTSILINVITQIEHEGDWVYTKDSLRYKQIDCIGLILVAAKFHFTRKAFYDIYNIGLGTTSAISHGNVVGELKSFTGDTTVLVPGTIMFCKGRNGKKRGHVGIYVGYYVDRYGNTYEHAVIHCQGPAGSPVIAESLFDSRFSMDDAEYALFSYLDYDTNYVMTVLKSIIPEKHRTRNLMLN